MRGMFSDGMFCHTKRYVMGTFSDGTRLVMGRFECEPVQSICVYRRSGTSWSGCLAAEIWIVIV